MRLKNIKLAGFKSFVDPTNVQLGTDMVAVIGPNGCGKSNIIDAVRWVLGESSAKNLRGESMADVIFNGSNARKPVGQASIELVFDNSDGTLGGEYGAFTEISVKRKVTRDGQSQYFINGSKARRRDITDIFLGTGLGPRSYAIIEQGMISRLIESKPEELRVFVEEAAGISKYKERRKETEKRIRHTRENLERLTDLREELDRQLQRLKRQAAAAEKYKALKADERILTAQTQALQWQRLQDQSSGQRQAIADSEIALEASIAEQRSIGAQIEIFREEHVAKNDAFNTVQAQFYNLGAEIARTEQSIAHHEQRAQQLADDLDEAIRSASENSQHLADDNEKLRLWTEQLSSLDPEHEQLKRSATDASEQLHIAETAMQAWQQEWDAFNHSAAEPQKNAEVQRSKIDQIEESLRGLANRLDRMNDELSGLDTAELEADKTRIELQINQKNAILNELEATISAGNEQVLEKREAQKNLSSQLDSARSILQQQRGKNASLEALQQASQSEKSEVNEWLSHQQLDSAPRLLDTLEVQHGWETAIETVLGEALHSVTLKSLDSVFNDLANLEQSNISFIELDSNVQGSASQIALPFLTEKLNNSSASGLLHNIFAADNLAQAAQYRTKLGSHDSIVTKDGIWLGVNWLKVLKQQGSKSGVIERRQQLLELAKEISISEKSIASLEQSMALSEQALIDAEQARSQLQADKSQGVKELGQLRADISALTSKIEQISTRHSRTLSEIQLAESNQQQQRMALTEARQHLDVAIESMQKVEEQRETLILSRDSVRDTLTKARDLSQAESQALQSVALKTEGLRAQLNSVTDTVERLTAQVDQLEEKKVSLAQAKQDSIAPIAAFKTSLDEQLKSRVIVEGSLSQARIEVENLDQSMRESEQLRTNNEEKTQVIRAELERLRIDSQEMSVRSKTIVEQLEESGFNLEAVKSQLPEDADLVQWQTQLKELQDNINRLGAINLAAIEEFETESERKIYLDAQNEELESALSTLESAIQKIDRETRSIFKETFDLLNNSLQDLFPKVFGGGTAYLEMTGEDLLDTGIAIMARPPGKRNSTIHLLSGGEKALTAIALVFSIFQLNPAPFCMLDEVDAPLDDANTARYAKLIKEMSDRVQFIFITHNKITMEMADHLMGVTMHEPGCSRLVSVDIDEAVALAAV